MSNEERQPLPLAEHPNYVTARSASGSPSNSPSNLAVPPSSKPKLSSTLVVAAAGALLGCSFQFGYNNSVINTTAGLIKDWINSTYVNSNDPNAKDGVSSYSDWVTLIFSIVVSIWAIGGLIGALSAGFFADRFGRRRAILFNNIVAIVGAVLMAVAKPSGSVVPLILGRLVSGINCGVNTVYAPMFLAEIAPRHLRGAFGVLHQLVIVTGILLSQVVGLPSLLGSVNWWPWALALTAAPALLQPLLFICVPESPRYLGIYRQDVAAATSGLRRLRGGSGDAKEESIRFELRQMEEEAAKERSAPRYNLCGILTNPVLRQPFAIAVVLHLSQQLCGINGIFYYSTELFKSVGLTAPNAIYASIGTFGLLVVATLISVPLMEKVGRRTLMLVGLAFIIVFEIVLTIALSVGGSGGGGGGGGAAASRYIGLVSIVATVAAFAIGPGSIPWFYPAEIFPQGPRAVAMSFGCGVNWLANFVVGVSFEHLQRAIHGLCFLPFIVVSVCFWIFAVVKMPETKNKTMTEIQAVFEGRAGGVALR